MKNRLLIGIQEEWKVPDNLYKRKLPVCDIGIYEPREDSLPELTYEKIHYCTHCGSEYTTTCSQC